jgi:DNA-directed RNA polymerase specialized sigma24 family protein
MALEIQQWREEYGCAYQKWFPLTVRFLGSKGLSTDAAQEIAQAAWARGWEHRGQLHDAAFLLTWVNTIALNLYRRSLQREPKFLAIRETPTGPGLNWASFDVPRILNGCTPADRAILRQHHLEERPIQEIARAHRCSETAIRIRLVRARRSARAHMRRPPRRGGAFAGDRVSVAA